MLGGAWGEQGSVQPCRKHPPSSPTVPPRSPQGNEGGRRLTLWTERKGSPSQTGQSLAWARGWVYLDGQESGAVSEGGTAKQRLRGRVRGSG